MIAKLKGLLDETGADWAVIDVAGVGYLVHCSTKTLAALGETGEGCTLYTDLQVSENDMRLLGFAEAAERDWFRLLTGVQGVGSKVALAILSALSTAEVQAACAGGDAATVARAQGVGPKLAGRIVNELKEKAGALPAGPGGTSFARPSRRGQRRCRQRAGKPRLQTRHRHPRRSRRHDRAGRGCGRGRTDPRGAEEGGGVMRALAQTRHPELGSGSIPPHARSNRLHPQRRRQIMPIGVLALDQIDFPLAMPALQLFFAACRSLHIAIHFEVHKTVNAIPFRETRNRVGAMLMQASDKVRRYANVERPIWLARQDIDAGVAFDRHGTEFAARWMLESKTCEHKQVQHDDSDVEVALSAMTAHAMLQQRGYTVNPF